MVTKTWLLMLVLCTPVAIGLSDADEPEIKDRWFYNCFLYEADGRIWLREPMIYLGMVGVAFTPPFHLSQNLAKQFTPFVSTVGRDDIDAERSHFFYTFRMPRLRDDTGLLILLSMEAKMRPIVEATPAVTSEPYRPSTVKSYEIVSARMTAIEGVTNKWLKAWQNLDGTLKEIVSVSMSPPDDQKREQLSQAIERASQALNTMVSAKVGDDFRNMVSKIDPNTRLVRMFQKRVTDQWQEQLENYATRLRIKPEMPLPQKSKECPVLELLAESQSPADFISQIKKSCSPDALEQPVVYSGSLGRLLHVWEIEKLTQPQFEETRDRAKKIFEERRAYKARPNMPKQSENPTYEQWGVLLRPADADLLAEKLILRGAVVQKVLTEQPFGLRIGDIILDYGGIYDIVMWDSDFARSMKQLGNKVNNEGKLRILRDDNIMNLPVQKNQ